MQTLSPTLLSWATDLDPQTTQQALRTSRLPILAGPVALMPDAHLGLGATVGSVVATEGELIPSCVGVDIGCGMAAVRFDLTATDLPDSLDPLLSEVARVVPAGVGRGHEYTRNAAATWLDEHRPRTELDGKQARKALEQLGTLGSGNHFVELCLDESDGVWLVLHSGSRGIGNQLATGHISEAKAVAKRLRLTLEDPSLAYVLEGTPEFEHYLADLLWAQAYAAENRAAMLRALVPVVLRAVGRGRAVETINCHHNYAAQEVHEGRTVWVTRKGAIRAGLGEAGIIPGSMGAASYIVEGLGNPASWQSCSHGAGRTMSRSKAKKALSADSLAEAMAGKAWLAGDAARLVDEHPSAYKDIDQVMANQTDLVRVRHQLRQVLNYKGL